ncbi:hypothetical protein JCM8097_000632 [Rhodosporidiobolus ruineniae]
MSSSFTLPSQQHPAPPPPPQNGGPPRWEAQLVAHGNAAVEPSEEGLEGAAGANSGRSRYGPQEVSNVDKISTPGQVGSAAAVAAAQEAPMLDLTASDNVMDEEEVGWEVWWEALEDFVSVQRARRHARGWRDSPKSDAEEARGHAAFAIHDVLSNTRLALHATACDKARDERISQHRRREQHRQAPPLPP